MSEQVKKGRKPKASGQESIKTERVAPDYENKVLVVIPYLDAAAQGREIEFAVAGWRKYFKEDYLIVIVGDHHPVCDSGDDVFFIDCPRVERIEGQYHAHVDHVHKFRKVREYFPKSRGFIYACDDMYAVNAFDLSTVQNLKKESNDIPNDPESNNRWRRDQAKTRAALIAEGLPTINYICHLPVWYDWDKLFAIYDKYQMDTNSYVVENLYFNTYYKDFIAQQTNLDYDNLRCFIARRDPDWSNLPNMLKRKIWMVNTNAGYTLDLEVRFVEFYGL